MSDPKFQPEINKFAAWTSAIIITLISLSCSKVLLLTLLTTLLTHTMQATKRIKASNRTMMAPPCPPPLLSLPSYLTSRAPAEIGRSLNLELASTCTSVSRSGSMTTVPIIHGTPKSPRTLPKVLTASAAKSATKVSSPPAARAATCLEHTPRLPRSTAANYGLASGTRRSVSPDSYYNRPSCFNFARFTNDYPTIIHNLNQLNSALRCRCERMVLDSHDSQESAVVCVD